MNEKVFVPPIKIQGIKTKLVPLIRKNVFLNKDSVWYEPFMGSGVVGFNVKPDQAVFSDTNPYIIDFYNQIKCGEITHNLVRSYLEQEGKKLEEKDAAYYYFVRERFNKEHNPLDFLFLNRCCFNGMIRFNGKHEFNVPYGHKPQRFAKAYVTKIVNQITYVENQLNMHDWIFVCQSFEDTIRMAGQNDFIYCDPPYIDRHVDYYDSWDIESEMTLHDSLIGSEAQFMVSTWHHNHFRTNEYIEKIWADCFILTQEHFYHIGAKEKNRNSMTEALLTNYPITENKLPNENMQLSFDDIIMFS